MSDISDKRRAEYGLPPRVGPRPRRPDNTRAGLIVVGMLCATAVLISFACAFGMRAIG